MIAGYLTGSTWNPTEDGARRKPGAWMNGAKLPGFPKLPTTPKARRDRDVTTYGARLTATIKDDTLRAGNYIGAAVNGWRLVHTDGHRAVLLRGDAEPDKTMPPILTKWPVQAIALEPEVFNILKRMRAANSAKRPGVRLVLKASGPTAGKLTISTRDPEDGTTAKESIPVTGVNLKRADVTFDVRYLLDALGLWPATLRLGSVDDPAWVCTDASRYCVMPMREGAVKPYKIRSEQWGANAVAVAPASAEAPHAAPPRRLRAVPRPIPATPLQPSAPASGASPGLTAGQKAALTRAARIASGELTVDWRAAGLKAAATRRANTEAA